MEEYLDLHAITADELRSLFGCMTCARLTVGAIKYSKPCATLSLEITRLMIERRDGCLENCDCSDGTDESCFYIESQFSLSNITRLQCKNIDAAQPDKMLVLQSIDVKTKGDCPLCISGAGAAVITLNMNDGAAIRIEVDGVDSYLMDIGKPVMADLVIPETGGFDVTALM